MQKSPVPGSSGATLAERPHLEGRIETHLGGKKSASGNVSVVLIVERWGAMGVSTPDVSVHSLLIILTFSFAG